MAAAVIGALRVDLGLNSAQFTAGLAKAKTGMMSFGKLAAVGFAAAGTAAVAAGAAFGVAAKGVIDHADALNKASQSAGVSVEALSRLEYAGKFADVSLEQLSGGLKKLSVNMMAVAQNSKSGVAVAFQALGISVKDASGELRNSDAVFSDVADRFSRMEDGATKTSLVVQIFGKTGADLIPILNEGADGLKRFADESDRTGNTISTKTAVAAERFNDTLTSLQTGLHGVVNKIVGDGQLLAALQGLADTLASPEFASSMVTFANLVISTIDAFARATAAALGSLQGLKDYVQENMNGPGAVSEAGVDARIAETTTKVNELKELLANFDDIKDLNPQAFDTMRMQEDQFLADLEDAETLLMKYQAVKVRWQATNNPGAVLFPALDLGIDAPGKGLPGFDQFSKLFGKDTLVIKPIDTSAAVKSLDPLIEAIDYTGQAMADMAKTISDSVSDAFVGFADAVMSGVNPLKAMGDELANVGKQLLNAGIRSLVSSLFGFAAIPNAGVGLGIDTPNIFRSTGDLIPHATGGISNVPAIFGESGPEAAVPLPDGRRIPVELRGGVGGGETIVRVELGPELVGKILQQSANQSVQIVKAQAPAAVAMASRNKTF